MTHLKHNESMGIGFIPGTFPTSEVQDRLFKIAPASQWPRSKVNSIYFAYRDSVVKDKKRPYHPGTPEVKAHLVEKFNIPQDEVTFFTLALYQLVKEGRVNPKFLNFVEPESGTVKDAVKRSFIDSGLNKYLNTLKWISIAGVVGIVVYFSWPILSRGRKALK